MKIKLYKLQKYRKCSFYYKWRLLYFTFKSIFEGKVHHLINNEALTLFSIIVYDTSIIWIPLQIAIKMVLFIITRVP